MSVQEFDALGTRWWVDIRDSDSKQLRDTLMATVRNFEDKYSRFKPDSQLTLLNQKGFIDYPSEELQQLVEYGLRLYRKTQGLFNISVGGELEGRGYGLSGTRARASTMLEQDVTLSKKEIRLSHNIHLDFGGFGKGWLVDMLAAKLESKSRHYIINAGGDIRAHVNTPVTFALEHPTNSHQFIGTTTFSKGALAASSVIKRRWKNNNGQFTHIIEQTKNDTIAAHIWAPTATLADTWATIALLAPPEAWLPRVPASIQSILLIDESTKCRVLGDQMASLHTPPD